MTHLNTTQALTLLSCDRRPSPADVGGLAEVQGGPQGAQSGAALQASAHPPAAAGSRKNRSNLSLQLHVSSQKACSLPKKMNIRLPQHRFR